MLNKTFKRKLTRNFFFLSREKEKKTVKSTKTAGDLTKKVSKMAAQFNGRELRLLCDFILSAAFQRQ